MVRWRQASAVPTRLVTQVSDFKSIDIEVSPRYERNNFAPRGFLLNPSTGRAHSARPLDKPLLFMTIEKLWRNALTVGQVLTTIVRSGCSITIQQRQLYRRVTPRHVRNIAEQQNLSLFLQQPSVWYPSC
jgi:hypothetical protein